MLSKCKQVTVADVISGWHFSGPLADQIRRKNGSPVAIAQSGQDVPSFGISSESWVVSGGVSNGRAKPFGAGQWLQS